MDKLRFRINNGNKQSFKGFLRFLRPLNTKVDSALGRRHSTFGGVLVFPYGMILFCVETGSNAIITILKMKSCIPYEK